MSQRGNTTRIRQRVGRNIITSIRYMNTVLTLSYMWGHKRMRKYAWSDVSRSSIRFTYSSVARHIGPCICHNSQTYTWNDVIPYKGRMICVFYLHFFVIWRNSSQWVMASSFTRFLDRTQRRTTVSRTVLDEWLARRRDLYLTTHNTHNRHPCPPVGFEPTISVGERP